MNLGPSSVSAVIELKLAPTPSAANSDPGPCSESLRSQPQAVCGSRSVCPLGPPTRARIALIWSRKCARMTFPSPVTSSRTAHDSPHVILPIAGRAHPISWAAARCISWDRWICADSKATSSPERSNRAAFLASRWGHAVGPGLPAGGDDEVIASG